MTKQLTNDADVLRALLNGEVVQDLFSDGRVTCEWYLQSGKVHRTEVEHMSIPTWCKNLRIRSKTININGYEVPEPLREAPKIGTRVWGGCMV